jgi:hypothetical protein
MINIRAEGIRFGFDARTGLLDGFAIEDEGRDVAPLHRAPWVGRNEELPPDIAPHVATLGGDFFCAPFSGSENGSPLHGWTANSPWHVVEQEEGRLRAKLKKTVHGAVVTKELEIKDGHPFVYQRHIFTGGNGSLPVSNHANVSLPRGGLIRFSPKSYWQTLQRTPEPDPLRGRSCLVYPARSSDPTRFPGIDSPVDLTRYPWAPRHEDFIIGVEAPGHQLGWTAVARPAEGDLYLSLRNARKLPMTMLWHSNGGRDYPPWSSRHLGCLGVEEGAAAHLLGPSGADDLAGPGALSLNPDGVADVNHVIGAVSWPSGEPVSEIGAIDGMLEISGDYGTVRQVPFNEQFLK